MERSNGRIWLGVIFIVIGGLLVLDNMDFIYFDLFSWPVILIIVGVVMLINSKNLVPGIILIILGGLFLSEEIFFFSAFNIIADYWPIAIILVGLVIIFGRGGPKNQNSFIGNNFSEEERRDYNSDTIDDTSVFSDHKFRVTSKNFKGGRITTTFASHTIDLYDAELAEGTHVLDIVTVFGGIELIIPREWKVNVQVTSILGGFEDKRRVDPNLIERQDKILVIKGTVLLGGGEIKS